MIIWLTITALVIGYELPLWGGNDGIYQLQVLPWCCCRKR
jgi:hypothetical protein